MRRRSLEFANLLEELEQRHGEGVPDEGLPDEHDEGRSREVGLGQGRRDAGGVEGGGRAAQGEAGEEGARDGAHGAGGGQLRGLAAPRAVQGEPERSGGGVGVN